jgi:hypothetical protein
MPFARGPKSCVPDWSSPVVHRFRRRGSFTGWIERTVGSFWTLAMSEIAARKWPGTNSLEWGENEGDVARMMYALSGDGWMAFMCGALRTSRTAGVAERTRADDEFKNATAQFGRSIEK